MQSQLPSHIDESVQINRLRTIGHAQQWDPQDIDWGKVGPLQTVPDRLAYYWKTWTAWYALEEKEQQEILHTYAFWVLSMTYQAEVMGVLLGGQLICQWPSLEGKLYATQLAAEEGRHAATILELIQSLFDKDPAPMPPAFENCLNGLLEQDSWLMKVGILHLGEHFGRAVYTGLRRTDHGPIREVYGRISADKGRHLAFGKLNLDRYLNGPRGADREAMRIWLPAFAQALRELIIPRPVITRYSLGDSCTANWDSISDTHPGMKAASQAMAGYGFELGVSGA